MKTRIQICLVVFFVFSTGRSVAQPCDAQSLQALFNAAASLAESLVQPGDRSVVLEAVAPYPEGSDPPRFIAGANNEPVLEMPSKAAAFFMAGVEAVTLDNKLVAGWCFLEAAKRNPTEPNFLNNTAFILLQYDLYSAAKMVLECVNILAPDYTPAYVNLGYALNRLADPMGAAMNYLSAYLMHPTDSDYLYLTSREFARVGLGEIASALAMTGLNNFPNDYDFGSFANLSSDPPTVMPTGELSAVRSDCSPAQSAAASEVRRTIDEEVARLAESMWPNIESESWDIGLEYMDCNGSWGSRNAECKRESHAQFHDRCDCMHEPPRDWCAVERSTAEYRLGVRVAGLEIDFGNTAAGSIINIVEASRHRLCDYDYNSLLVRAEMFRPNYATIFDFSEDVALILEDLAYWAASIGFYCSDLGPTSVWVPVARIGTSLEPSQCLSPRVPLCASHDLSSGTYAVSANIHRFSGKLSRDPVTGGTVLSTGLSRTYGGVGAGVVFKYSHNRVGFAPKIIIGSFDMEAFIGFERIDLADQHWSIRP
jgi:tetratricopeptide (TPR) repeat protein